jgi:hypothetical protein
MLNYIIRQCLTEDDFIISSTTVYTTGIGVKFGEGENLYCGTIISQTDESYNPLYYINEEDTDCCQCLLDTGVVLNFKFRRCDTGEYVCIQGYSFCESFGAPIVGVIYQIQFESEPPFCANFEGLCLEQSSGATGYNWYAGGFGDCEVCGEVTPTNTPTETPIPTVTPTNNPTTPTVTPTNTPTPSFTPNYTYSSGTEYVDCVICDTVATTVNVPHPVAINNQGNAVVQLGAVTLGGPNGLNN